MEPSPIDGALDALPHGPEFRFLDKLTRLDHGRSGAGEYVVPPAAPFLKGHFPGAPLMPAVLMIEAVAQLAGTIAQSDPEIRPLSNLRLTAIRAAKIFGPALPGQTMEMQAQITGRLGGLVQARGSVSVNGRILLEADLVLAGETQ